MFVPKMPYGISVSPHRQYKTRDTGLNWRALVLQHYSVSVAGCIEVAGPIFVNYPNYLGLCGGINEDGE
jgi:hypothetical protein